MYDKFGQFINGNWVKSSGGETYDVINPANEEIIGKASKANKKDIDLALQSAQKGYEIWKNTSPWERSKIIRKISDVIRDKKDVLAKWLTLEVGKPLTESTGEVLGAADIFEWSSEEAKEFMEKLFKVAPLIRKYMYIISRLVLLLLLYRGTFLLHLPQEKFQQRYRQLFSYSQALTLLHQEL